jgi:hypothetical protein
MEIVNAIYDELVVWWDERKGYTKSVLDLFWVLFVKYIDEAKKDDGIRNYQTCTQRTLIWLFLRVNCDILCILSIVKTLYHRSLPLHFESWLLIVWMPHFQIKYDGSQVTAGNLTPFCRVPLETLTHSAGQDIPSLSRNPKVRYLVQKSPPLAPILSHIHSANTLTPSFFKSTFNIFIQSTSRFLK